MKYSMYPKIFSCFLSGLVFALATLTPGISDATTYYVAKTGNDSNPGTEISPFRNIKHGVSRLSAGDKLYVKAGTYNESISSWNTTIPNGTSWANPVTVAANPGDIVIINPPSDTAFFWINDGQAKYLIIDGFIVDGNYQAMHGFKFMTNTRYVRVQNSEIRNSAHSGILVTLCSGCQYETYHEFINLKVHDNGSDRWMHGLYIETSNNVIEGSAVYHNSGYGVHIFRSGEILSANKNIVRNSSFYGNNTAGAGCGLLIGTGMGNTVYNNTVYNNDLGICTQFKSNDALIFNNVTYQNAGHGIKIGGFVANGTRAYNNTAYDNGGSGIFVGDGSRDAVIQNNIAYKNKIDNIYLQPDKQTGTTASYNFTDDPLFLDPSAKVFSLTPKSPVINRGASISLVLSDIIGTKRPQDSGYDIGAYELLSDVDTDPPHAPEGVKAF